MKPNSKFYNTLCGGNSKMRSIPPMPSIINCKPAKESCFKSDYARRWDVAKRKENY